jgi:signal transduction histidine kinase/ActR/RegA family two-component response regulator
MVEAGSGADAILVGMGNPPTGEPWTYPLVLELCELSLLVESTLSRNRMHASAVRAADQEILDRLQREETLRLSEQKYHKLFANMPAGMALFSLDGGVKDATKFTITETNPAFERYADILGKEGDNEAAISPPVRRQLSALVRRVSRSSLPVSLSNYAGFVKGRFFDLQLFAASENRVGLVLTETTERRKTEQRVLLSQRIESIGLMTSGLAHELTNTISPGMLALDLLKKRVDDNESRDTIDLIGKSLQRGADIISSILLFATGAQEKKILIHPAKVLKEVVEISRKTFPRDVTISLDVKNPVLLAMADGTKLHQVLTNIMINARDAMPSGGEIFLRMDALQSETGEGGMAPGNYICITVSDTGTGIPKEIQGKIFEPFFTTKQTGKGTGLGLSTAIRIVNEYGGRLTVKSEIGKGATFQVLLPSSSASTASAPVRLEVVGETRGAGRLVLIVDDELPIRLVATQVLKEHGFAAIAASNGAEAVDLLRASGATPSLAIIDLMMPFMGGGPLIDRLRSTHPLMRVIAISGMVFDASFEEKASDLRKKGVSLLLKKPFREASLLAAIRKVDTLPPWSGAEMPGVSGQGKPEKEQERAA